MGKHSPVAEHAEDPHGISLEQHAQISAEIAEGTRPQAEVLAGHDISDEAWMEATIHWMTRLGEDVQTNGSDATLPHVYSHAFSIAQDALSPVATMTVEDYAKLVVDVQRAGAPDRPLAARRMSNADYLRVARHFATAIAEDSDLSERFFATYEALQPKPPKAE